MLANFARVCRRLPRAAAECSGEVVELTKTNRRSPPPFLRRYNVVSVRLVHDVGRWAQCRDSHRVPTKLPVSMPPLLFQLLRVLCHAKTFGVTGTMGCLAGRFGMYQATKAKLQTQLPSANERWLWHGTKVRGGWPHNALCAPPPTFPARGCLLLCPCVAPPLQLSSHAASERSKGTHAASERSKGRRVLAFPL